MQSSTCARAGSAAPAKTVHDRLLAATPDDLAGQLLTFQAILDHFPGGISILDNNLRLVAYNEQFKSMHGYPDSMFEPDPPHLEDIFRFNAERGEYGPGDVEGLVAERLALVRKREAHHYERWRSNGSLIEVRGAPLAGGGFVTTYFDITEKWHNQNTIHHMAHHDQLTDLANRRLLRERLGQALAATRHGAKFAVHCIDLDKFKPVNDTYGHAAGDEVLKLVAERLRRFSRNDDTVARIGGDEFVLIQAGINGRGNAETLAKRIELEMLQPFIVDGETIRIGASVGTALAPDDGDDADTLFQVADAALYEAKNAKHARQAGDRALLKLA